MPNLNQQVATATKWSAITEVMGKLVAPVSSMILARLLTPEAFGVVATLNMVIAFAEIFTDAGFQKYLIQQPFKDAEDRDKDTNVAFWTNLVMSCVLWGIIAIFAEPLATLVGNPGLGIVLIVACASIPLAAFSSIQMALFKKDLDFKTLFYRRLVAIIVPLVVTVPLAFWMRSYWALVIGTICVNLANAVILMVMSDWHPRFYYSFARLRNMFAFCSWAILDAILIWATGYMDIFFIGIMLNEHYLGLYKTSMTTVGQITALITSTILPVIMPALAKVRDDHAAMRELLLRLQKYTAILLLPVGFGIFVFSDLITEILLGSQWKEASPFIGLWGLIDVLMIVFARFCSNIYPAIGRSDIAVICQLLHVVVLIPAVYIAANYSFTALYWTRSLVRIQLMVVNMFFAYYLIRQSPWKMIKNILPELLSSVFMVLIATMLLNVSHSLALSIVWVLISIIAYSCLLILFPAERIIMRDMIIGLYKKVRNNDKDSGGR
ncbi:MAG: lipopolysaccharide biosynthesis protein [Bacteroidaceae bacterium]|nr:lipopolysaccharide biosynthesis protein [Bacteroidaceae bacterium]